MRSPRTSAPGSRRSFSGSSRPSGLVNVAHQLGASLGLSILVAVFAAIHPGNLDANNVLAHRVSAAFTGGTALLALALVLVVLLIVRPRRPAPVADNDQRASLYPAPPTSRVNEAPGDEAVAA